MNFVHWYVHLQNHNNHWFELIERKLNFSQTVFKKNWKCSILSELWTPSARYLSQTGTISLNSEHPVHAISHKQELFRDGDRGGHGILIKLVGIDQFKICMWYFQLFFGTIYNFYEFNWIMVAFIYIFFNWYIVVYFVKSNKYYLQ